MSKKFNSKNSTRFAVVHRSHDDPRFYDEDASPHVLVPVEDPNAKHRTVRKPSRETVLAPVNENVGTAALYGINFDDSKYDYTQHLKPIGQDPSNSIFIPAKGATATVSNDSGKVSLRELIAEDVETKTDSMFQRGGTGKSQYLRHQQSIPDEISGFRPDMNPALQEALLALEDEAYVVNKDIVVESKIKEEVEISEEDDVFAQLLEGGEIDSAEAIEDEWDADFDNYEDQNYLEEMKQFDAVENFEDLENIDYQADVQRFKDSHGKAILNKDDDLESVEPESEEDTLGELPTIEKKSKNKKSKSKERRKKGAMSDVSGFSMSSSAIARTETMTILDDKYDQIIGSYENYQEEQDEDEMKTYEPFDMDRERPGFEQMLDDFLDNYELDVSGRKLVKKDAEVEKWRQAADEASKSKLAARRKKERNSKKNVSSITSSLTDLHI